MHEPATAPTDRPPAGGRAAAVRRAGTGVVAALLLVGALAACSGDDDGEGDGDAGPGVTTTGPAGATAAVPEGAVPRGSAVAAVEALLGAEVERDRATSWSTIGGALRVEFPTLGAWERRRDQLGDPTGFTVEPGPSQAVAVATVTHVPSLDPFRGLVFAQERQTWTAEAVPGGWLVVAEPAVEPVLPADDGAVAAATGWAEAVRACDEDGARAYEGVSILFGDATVATGLCGSAAAVVAGTPGPLASGVASADIVAQYSSDALLWARVVPLTAPVPFGVILAPVGDDWRVIGVAPS